MEGFEPMVMSQYMGSPLSLERGNSNENYLGSMPLNISEQSGTYETGDFAAG